MQISLIYIVYTVHEKILGFLAGTFLCRTLYSDEKKDDDDVNDVRVCGIQKQDESLAERTTTQTSADETVETEKAAVRIQAASRGYLARCRLKHTR